MTSTPTLVPAAPPNGTSAGRGGDSAFALVRKSSARWLVPIGTAVVVGRVLYTSNWWLSSWANTTLTCTDALIFLFPFVMLAAALDARRRVRASAGAGLSVWGWSLAGFAVVLAVAYAAPARLNPQWPPPVPWVWLLPAVTALLAYAGLGVLTGAMLAGARRRLLPVAAGLAVLLGYLAPTLLAADEEWTSTRYTVLGDGWLGGPEAPNPSLLVLQALFFALLGLLALAVAALDVRPGRGVGALVVTLTAGLLVTGMTLGTVDGSKTTWVRDAAGPRACATDRVVCVWTDHGSLLGHYTDVGHRMLADAPPTLPVRGWVESGLARGPGEAEVYLVGRSSSEPVDVAWALAGGLVDGMGTDARRGYLERARLWLVARVLAGKDRSDFLAGHEDPAVRAILTQPPDKQWAWFFTTLAGR
ncbi:hypothetical protein GCM10023321_01660 [Pseudonocardia eucalypti]|uniref:Uncharacterized protein n=1 Tax=Pseudonocardia eucalypti TaxID=648755 RepID=A0ABP9PF68_9PSEU|nr:hypothetical protein [Pseudonocardia eucalypti]